MQIISRQEAFQALEQNFPDFDWESQATCLAFLDAAADFYAAVDAQFEQFGLSSGKFTILMQLYTAKRSLSPSEFANRANVTRATITGLLDRLERDGLVERQNHPSDRRMLTVHLTRKGKTLVEQVLPEHFCRTKDIMTNLTAKEKQTLIKLLGKLRSGISGASDSN